MSSRKRVLIILTIISCAFIIVAIGTTFYILHLLFSSPEPTGTYEEIEFEVEQGERLDSIADRLHRQGLLIDPSALKLTTFLRGGSRNIKAGVHKLRKDWSAWKIYEQLQISPKAKYHKLVIPEGLDSFEIAGRIEDSGIGSAEEFLRKIRNPGSIHNVCPEAKSMEGFLFPDTYHVPANSDIDDVLEMMLQRFSSIATEELREEFSSEGLTLFQGIILASMIAREAGNAEEMPLISSVFHNRLRIGMKLDCDPTFIYARKLNGTWDGQVRGEDRELDSEYNTYRGGGLPPGPIGNPGTDALMAAARPAETNYLYFVAKSGNAKDGHYFSSNSAEHNRARELYRKKLREAQNDGR